MFKVCAIMMLVTGLVCAVVGVTIWGAYGLEYLGTGKYGEISALSFLSEFTTWAREPQSWLGLWKMVNKLSVSQLFIFMGCFLMAPAVFCAYTLD